MSPQHRVKAGPLSTPRSRRAFLREAAAWGLGAWSAGLAWAQQAPPATRPAGTQPALPKPWWCLTDEKRARVVDARSERVLRDGVVDEILLGEMLDRSVQQFCDTRRPEPAWRRLLGKAERIVVKFNSVGADVLATNEPLADVLLDRLEAAGYAPGAITLVEVDHSPTRRGTRAVTRGWGASIAVGGNPEQLAAYLLEADAIINVPFLKTHQVAGMSGSLKNISHAVIRQPARYHANGCAPYIGHVIGAEAVSSRLKLHIVNALRVIVAGGPAAERENVVGYGGLLLGTDPVAIDTVGLSVLASERRRRGLDAAVRVPGLASAAELGLGRWRPGDVERLAIGMGD